MANVAKDPHSMAVSTGTSNADLLRRSRRDQSDNPTPEQKEDFIINAIDAGEPIFVTNRNGGTHSVPAEWVTEDEVGVVRVRGNTGYRYATSEEISNWHEDQGLEDDGSAKSAPESVNLEDADDMELKVQDPPSEANAKTGANPAANKPADNK
jgi:hypothetical protein